MQEPATLTRRTLIGLVQLLAVVFAFVFVPAWSLDYWQGWLFWFVFAVAMTLISFHFLRHDPELVERRLRFGPHAEKDWNQKVILTAASVLFLALIALPGFDHRFGWSDLSASTVLLGNTLVALSLLLVFLVFRENSYASAAVEIGTDQSVVSTGPYRFVRHPLYASALIMTVGVPLALGSAWTLLLGLPMLTIVVARIVYEERFLAENLPGYEAYCSAMPYRLIPWVY